MSQLFINLDITSPIAEQLRPMLRQHGFTQGNTKTPPPEKLIEFENKMARLIYKGKNVPLDCGNRIRELANEKQPEAITALTQASNLLTTWGLSNKGQLLSHTQEEEILNEMCFGKGKGVNKYGDKRWPALTRKETLLYDFGFETDLTMQPAVENLENMLKYIENMHEWVEDNYEEPQALLATSVNNIGFSIHRKPATASCAEASKHRVCSKTGAIGVNQEQELKSLLLKANKSDTGETLYALFQTFGDNSEIVPESIIEYAEDYAGITVEDFDPALASKFGLATGRVNPVSMQNVANKDNFPLIQIFDQVLLSDDTKPHYTNIGANTWGIEIENMVNYIVTMQKFSQQQAHPSSKTTVFFFEEAQYMY